MAKHILFYFGKNYIISANRVQHCGNAPMGNDSLPEGQGLRNKSCLNRSPQESNVLARTSASGPMAFFASILVLVWAPTSIRLERGSICKLKR